MKPSLMVLLYFLLLWFQWSRILRRGHARHFGRPAPSPAPSAIHAPRKPEWVARELIRLKALSPDLSCRMLAEVFNRQFNGRERVGKTFVATVLRRSQQDIVRLRHELKHRIPPLMPRNRVWALDLTGKTDADGKQHMLLGLLDHGSRACLRLQLLSDKRSLTIFSELIKAFRQFGIPHRLRVDNEACFNSRLMKAGLALFGVQLQTTAPHCPWQNGRIERFFGTLKQHLDRIHRMDVDDLHLKLLEFRAWYNHARPHHHLHGHTPAEIWTGRGKSTKAPHRFEIWEGAITGWFFPP